VCLHNSIWSEAPEGEDVMVACVKPGHQHRQVVGLWATVGQVDHLGEEEQHLVSAGLIHNFMHSRIFTFVEGKQ